MHDLCPNHTVRQGGVDFVEAPANELELGNEMSMKEKEQK